MKTINKNVELKELISQTEGLPTDFVLLVKRSALKNLLIGCIMDRWQRDGTYSFSFDTDNSDWGIVRDGKTFGNYYSSSVVMTNLDEADDEEEITPIVEKFMKELNGTFDTDRRIKYIVLDGGTFNRLVTLGKQRQFDMLLAQDIIEIMMSE